MLVRCSQNSDRIRLLRDYLSLQKSMYRFFLPSKAERAQPYDLCLLILLRQKAHVVFYRYLRHIWDRIHYLLANLNIWVEALLTLVCQLFEINFLDQLSLWLVCIFCEASGKVFDVAPDGVDLLLFGLSFEYIFTGVADNTAYLFDVTHLLNFRLIVSVSVVLNRLISRYFEWKLLGGWCVALNYTFSQVGCYTQPRFLLTQLSSNCRDFWSLLFFLRLKGGLIFRLSRWRR